MTCLKVGASTGGSEELLMLLLMSNSRCLVAFDGLGRHDGMIKSWWKHR